MFRAPSPAVSQRFVMQLHVRQGKRDVLLGLPADGGVELALVMAGSVMRLTIADLPGRAAATVAERRPVRSSRRRMAAATPARSIGASSASAPGGRGSVAKAATL